MNKKGQEFLQSIDYLATKGPVKLDEFKYKNALDLYPAGSIEVVNNTIIKKDMNPQVIKSEFKNHVVLSSCVVECMGFNTLIEATAYLADFGNLLAVRPTGTGSFECQFDSIEAYKKLFLQLAHQNDGESVYFKVNSAVENMTCIMPVQKQKRMVEFLLDGDLHLISSSHMRAFFEGFASVKRVEYQDHAHFGFVEFASGVADRVFQVAKHQANLMVLDQVAVTLSPLKVQQEYFYDLIYEIKQKISPPAKAIIPPSTIQLKKHVKNRLKRAKSKGVGKASSKKTLEQTALKKKLKKTNVDDLISSLSSF